MAAFIRAGLAANTRSAGTWSERVLASVLRAFGHSIRCNEMIEQYNVDLIVDDRVVIECYGDYWHCNPEIYPANYYNKSLRCTAAAKWRRDHARAKHLIRLGYCLFIIWERDLRSRPELVNSTVQLILHALRR